MVEDNPNDAELILRELTKNGLASCVARVVEKREDFIHGLESFKPDIVLADYNLPSFGGIEAIKITAERSPGTPVIIVSGTIGEDIAIETLKKGAADYILKDRIARLQPAVYRALRDAEAWKEQEQTKEMIRMHELRFLTMIENSSDGILLVDADYVVTYAASSALRILGYAEADCIGKAVLGFVHPEDLEALKSTLTIVSRTKNEKRRIEVRLRHKDGTYRWVEAIMTGLLQEPSIGGIIINYRDITERKQTDAVARDVEKRYRSLFEETKDVVYMCTPEGKLLDINPAGVEVFGWASKEEMLKTPTPDYYVNPQEREVLFQLLAQQGFVKDFELELVRKDGKKLIMEETCVAEWDQHGVMKTVRGILRDITERREAETALRQSEERYGNLIENARDIVVYISRDGHLQSLNSAFEKVTGWQREEWIGKSYSLLMHPEDLQVFSLAVESALEGKPSSAYEVRMRTKDGEYVGGEISASPHIESGNIVGVLGIVRDISERKELEAHIRQAQKLESLGTLAGGIAHDINNILTIILAYAGPLRDGKIEKEKLGETYETIRRAVRRGANLVRQLLTFARKSDVSFETVKMNDGITELATILRETFPRDIEVLTQLGADIPAIFADVDQIHQALLNVCVNARDAMPAGGKLTIKTRVVSGDSVREKYSDADATQYVRIDISDTGSGMDRSTKDKIFEPFFTTKAKGKGTGLGLALVYGVVKSHRGYVDVESEPGRGTTFTLFFPVSKNEYQELLSVMEATSQIPGGKETILLVEDEEMLIDLLRTILEARGYTVMMAQDGMSGLDLYQQHKDEIDLIISDMGLPKLGGWEMFQRMKKINPKVKAILASGYLDPNLRAEMIRGGAKDFIQKPYEPDTILRRIREIFDAGGS